MEYTDKKGVKHTCVKGPRGGYYYIDDNGKKKYIKDTKPTKTKSSGNFSFKKEEAPKPKHYTAWIDVRDENGELVDDYKLWCNAFSEDEARTHFEGEIGSNDTITMIIEK